MKRLFFTYLVMLCTFNGLYGMMATAVADSDTDSSALAKIKLHKAFGADIHARYTGDKKEYQDHTALQIACLKGYTDVVHFLTSIPGIHTIASSPKHPLLIAVKKFSGKNHRDITRLLIAFCGSDVNTTNKHGRSALYIAAKRNNKEAVEELLDHKDILTDKEDDKGNTSLHAASTEGSIDIVQLLIAKNANVNTQSKQLRTPLHCASFNDNIEIVSLLLKSGANPALVGEDGMTPLHEACEQDHFDIINVLLTNNCKLLLVKDQKKVHRFIILIAKKN